MEDKRKKWTTPHLIVLGRGTPEENVLFGCKMSTLNGSGATNKKCGKGGGCNSKCSVISTSS